ncbi:MAG: phosphate ABC transporter substrate-binding protein [Clostridiales bacterium]|nr:phosphate ABC transporter substrate-binding protein [Clostridiales bacterium]
MKRIKFLTTLAMSVIIAAASVLPAAAASSDKLKIMLDGTELVSDQSPRIENNSTLVPIRVIAESLGGVVGYDPATKQVTITTADHKISLATDSSTATVDNKSVTLEVPMKNFNGRTFVPLRFVAESLGAEVDYSGATKTVTINYFSSMTGSLKLGGSTTIYPPSTAGADALMKLNKTLSITVAEGGSGAGIKGAASGEFNIGNASTSLSSSDKTTYPTLVETKIGSDAVAIIINPKNPVKNLTKQQIYDIFTGKIVNWKDVGGNDSAILIQTRESTSGTLDCMNKLAIQKIDKTGKIIATATPHNSTGLMLQAVKDNENAIGFASLGYLDSTIKAVSIDDIECTFNNAFAGIYAYIRPLNMITNGTPAGNTAKFINFMRSPEGQKIMTDEHYLPLVDKYLK